MMNSSNHPEIVVVTGASAGVGRATARAFAKQGAHVGLLARGRAGLEGAKRDVEALGGKALILEADVADADAVEAAAMRVEKEFGPIDVWVNNAMVSVFSPFSDMTPAEFKRVTEVTYLGYVHGTMVALRRMRERNRGKIIQVGSALAYRSIPLQSAYCGAKHAIVGFTDSIRSELLHQGSRINITVVHLPALNTPQFNWTQSRMPRKPQPVPPIFQPEVAAEAILWAARHDRREIFVGLNTNVILWGNKFFPGFGDKYLAKTGYESQQYDGRADPDRPSNLWQPVDRDKDYGAHGDFDMRARDRSVGLWLSQHRGWLALLGGLAAGALYSTAKRGASGSG
jgi:short-subunit dehydrogenase